MTAAEFNKKQFDSLMELIRNPEPTNGIEKDIFNLKYIRYSINYECPWYDWGMIETLDRAIKSLEKLKGENDD